VGFSTTSGSTRSAVKLDRLKAAETSLIAGEGGDVQPRVRGLVTLLYSVPDEAHNHAGVLREFLRETQP
jgi:hypothetical protein